MSDKSRAKRLSESLKNGTKNNTRNKYIRHGIHN